MNNKDALKNFVKKAQNPKPLGAGYEKALRGLDKYLKELKNEMIDDQNDDDKKDDKKKGEEVISLKKAYDKKHYSKFSTVARGLISACHVPKNKFKSFVVRLNNQWIGKDWITYFCASLYLGA